MADPAPSLPAMSFLTAPLVSPSSAQSFYGSATTHSNSFTGSANAAAFSGQPPEIIETARALKNDPDLIYEFVLNHTEIEFAFGERKGPLGALIDHSGTSFDQNVLFVNLVRQAGYQAQYVIAPVTMSQANFTSWSGISDIQAACRLLSSGGIPAAFNGAASSPSDCSQISPGSFSTVTFLHVYSQVSIGGTWYAFDPSFKSYTAPAGLNLVSSSGLVSGQAAQAAATNITTGSTSGAPYIQNASASSLNAYLTARGTALLAAIKANAPAMDTEGVVGIGKIIPAYKPTGGWRNSTPPAYTVASGITVTGDMPDQYRTKLHMNVASQYTRAQQNVFVTVLDWTFFADDIDGRRLGLGTNFNANELVDASQWTTQSARLVVDDVPIQAFSCTIDTSNSSQCLPDAPTHLTVSVSHPFAANSGTYGAQTLQTPASMMVPTAIVAGWGYVSPNRLAKWSSEKNSDTSLPRNQSPPYPCAQPSETCFPVYNSSSDDFTHQKTAADWLGQFSRLYKIQATIGHSVADHLHSIGVVRWNYQATGYDYPAAGQPSSKHYYGITDQFETTDLMTSVALTHTANSISVRNAIARSIALSGATLEGSLLEQTQDLPDSASTASRFAWANRPDNEDPCFTSTTPRPIYDFTGTTSATRANLYLYEGSASGCGAQPVIDLQPSSYSATQFENAQEGLLASYAAAGFHLSAPAEVFLGPGARFGRPVVGTTCAKTLQNDPAAGPDSGCSGTVWNYHSVQRGGALIATLTDTNGNVTQVANVLTGFGGGVLKGGGGKEPDRSGQYDPAKAADILKDRFVDKSVLLGVDLKTGLAGFTTPTLISAGFGKAPYKLDYSLTYKAAPDGCGPFGPCTSPFTNGFNKAWDIRFSNSGSGEEALGSTSPMAAAGTIAAFLVMQDIFSEADRTSLEKDSYASLTADWWRQQMVANVATVSRGFSGTQYVRLVDGSWMAPVGSPGVLTETGSRLKVRDVCYGNVPSQANPQSTSRRWDFSGVSFSLREAGGESLSFAPWSWSYNSDDMCANAYGYQPTTLNYPQGPSVSFTYDYQQGVTGITTSLGRSITLQHGGTAAGDSATIGAVTVGQSSTNSNAVLDAAGDTWNFTFVGPQTRSLTGYNRPIPFYRLQQVFEPVSSTLPALSYTYDSRGIVQTIQDATGLQTTHHAPYGLFIAEGARGERDDPLGDTYAVYYDTDGNAVRHIDQLGHEVDSVYDGRHRVTNRTFPEGDQEQFAYDANDNVTGLTKVAKPGSSLANIALSATYEPSWNKLASITDGLQHTTSFSYYASGNGASLMSQAVRPAVNGSSPTYTFAYNAIGLPTQEVDPTGVTTTHAYDSLGNPTGTTRGAAAVGSYPALNLTTTSTFDAVGNVASSTDPRGNVTSFTYDAMRRKLSEQNWSGTTSGTLIAAGQSTYDLNGRQLTSQRAKTINGSNAVTAWVTKTTAYTPNGKVSDVTDELGDLTHTSYDALDRVYQVTDPTGRVTQTNYNADSTVLSEQRAVGTPLAETYATYTYSADGFKTSTQDARNNITQDLPDGFNRLAKTTFPDGNTEIYTYDANDNVVTWQNRGGFQIQRTYDVLNRKITEKGITNGSANTGSRPWDIPDRSFSYDLAGRPTAADNSNWINHWAYDSAGRTATLANSLGNAFVYTYDGNDNGTSLTYPNSVQVGYAYDALNRMTGATLGGTSVATLAYDVLGRRTSTTFGDGSSTGYGYNDADRLTSQSQVFPNGTSANVTETFGYDNAGRLTSKAITNTAYQYTPPVATTSYAAADSMNRYTSVGGVSPTYWAEGEVFTDAQFTYVYDETGGFRIGYNSANNSEAPDHDALGSTISRTTQYAGGTDILQYYGIAERPEVLIDLNYTAPHNTSAWVFQGYRNYVLGPNPDERLAYQDTNGTIYYPHTDRQGTTIGLATAGQNVLTRTYGPYGEPIQPMTSGAGASSYPYLYTGQYYSSLLGLYDYKARLYNPIWGRFYQSDPIGTKDDLNLYQYTHNDPLDHTDPTGTTCADGKGPCSPEQLKQAQQQFKTYVDTKVAPETNRQLATGAAIVIGTGLTGGAALAEGGAVAGAGAAAESAASEGAASGEAVSMRTTRTGEPAATITKPDGSKMDISPQRVKEYVPNDHPNAPPGAMNRVRFNDALPGSKGFKRAPTAEEIRKLNNLVGH